MKHNGGVSDAEAFLYYRYRHFCRENGGFPRIATSAGAHSLGRPHIARVLVKKGYFPTVKDVFDTLIAAGKPAYLRQVKMSPFEAARIIHKAGGIAVLAHPAEIENLSYVEEILHSGVMDGMEVFHPSVLQEKNKHDWLAIAKKYHLMVSGGSDLHGNPGRFPMHLGEFSIPYDAVSEIVTYPQNRGNAK